MPTTGHPDWHLAAIFGVLFCVWVSLFLIVRLWVVHRRDSVAKRLFWTAVLCVPFFGWLFYGGCYTPPSENDVRAPVNTDVMSGGH